MKILNSAPREPIPSGKRRVHNNVWGNCVAYCGRERWMDLGPSHSAEAELRAEAFLAGEDPRDV